MADENEVKSNEKTANVDKISEKLESSSISNENKNTTTASPSTASNQPAEEENDQNDGL